MSEAKTKPVLNIDDVPLMDFGNGQKFAARSDTQFPDSVLAVMIKAGGVVAETDQNSD